MLITKAELMKITMDDLNRMTTVLTNILTVSAARAKREGANDDVIPLPRNYFIQIEHKGTSRASYCYMRKDPATGVVTKIGTPSFSVADYISLRMEIETGWLAEIEIQLKSPASDLWGIDPSWLEQKVGLGTKQGEED